MGAQGGVPAAPSSPVVVVLGGGQVQLSWGSPGSGEVRYEYAFSEQGFGQSSWVPPVDRVVDTSTSLAPTSGDRSGVVWRPVPGGGAARSVVVTGLTVGSSYRFWVRAVNTAGAGQILSMSPGDGHLMSGVPPAPVGLRAVVSDSRVELKWTKANGAVAGSGFATILRYEYAIKQGDGEWSGWSVMADDGNAAGDRESFVVKGLSNDVGYSFRVRAVNKHGNGATGEVGPTVVRGKPGAPRGFVVTPGDKSALLSWAPPGVVYSPVTGWEVRWAEDYTALTQAGWHRVPGGAGARSYNVRGLDNTKNYVFAVRAINALGAGAGTRSGFVSPGVVLGAPPDFRVKSVSLSSVTLEWSQQANLVVAKFQRYEYSVRAGDGDWGGWMAIPGDYTTTEFTVPGLKAGVGYRFRLRMVSSVGAGEVAETAEVVYPGTVPAAPAVTAEVVSDYELGLHQVVLSWTVDNGGSPITKWQFKISETVDGLDGVSWKYLCETELDSGCGALRSATLNKGRVSDGQGGTVCPHDDCDPDVGVGDRYFVMRGVNARGDGLVSGVVRVNIPKGLAAKAMSVPLRGYTANPLTTASAKPHMGEVSNSRNGGQAVRREYSWRVGDGPWGLWFPVEDRLSRQVQSFDELTFRVGETYTFRYRLVTDWGAGHVAGYVAESEPFVFGAPPLPGAAELGADSRDIPEVLAVPGNGQVELRIVRTSDGDEVRIPGDPPPPSHRRYRYPLVYQTALIDTDGVYADTVWEYSYRPVGGVWSPWAVAHVGQQFMGNTGSIGTDRALTVSGLRNGVSYEFRVRAVNRHGTGWLEGPALYSNGAGLVNKIANRNPDKVVIPGVKPPAPAGLTATGGDGQVSLSWTSAGSGGPPIIRWEYRKQSRAAADAAFGAWDTDWTPVPGSGPSTTQATVKGLTNGTLYRFQVRAVNALVALETTGTKRALISAGEGAAAQSLEVVPGQKPQAPRQVTVMAGDGEVKITVVAPLRSSSAGDAKWTSVLGYEVRVRRTGSEAFDAWKALGTPVSQTQNPSPATATPRHRAESAGVPVGGLVNGVGYEFEVRAVNRFGAGPAAGVVGPVTPTGAPAAGSLQATAGDGQVTLVWTPADTGGSTISGWQYRMKTVGGGYGSWTAVAGGAAARSLVVDGLANGRAYTFQIRAVTTDTEVIGTSFESEAVTPSAVPPAPAVTATAGDVMVVLGWQAGVSGEVGESNWAAAVTGWQYRAKPGDGDYGTWVDVVAATTTADVGDLMNGTGYVFEVRALNKMGPGTAATVTATPATVPAVPTVAATAGDEMVTVSWTPGNDGGSPVTGWQVRTGDGQWQDHPADTTSVPVQNLVNGTTYTFGVRARNAMGDGAVGVDTATPATVPAAPTVTATPGDSRVTLSWTPGADGGSAVTGWLLRIDDGEWVDLAGMGLGADATSVPVLNLTNGTSYTFQIRAQNAMGPGAVASIAATPAMVPAAPGVTATATDGTITVTWVAGGDGGSVVTGWQWRTRIGSAGFGEWADVGADTTSAVISGVDTGTGPVGYTFEVRAINAVGAGPAGTSPTITSGDDRVGDEGYYTGPVDSPNFCAEFSLGGARLFALDSDGDGVADVCSLPYTRREAIARHNAVITLANRYPDLYRRLVNAECVNQPDNGEVCGGDELAAPGFPPPNDGGPYYSGTITGPSWCANRSLGGPTTYPLDSDGDGVADTCSLPYTRREAIARQKAGDTLAATHRDEYKTILAEECRRLGRGNYGDSVADLNNDICNN
ncbi:fibronectin type III domain-containing protein [Candidatus Poriferisocius sp.]|uniref:fibronectin type III domain-containing protein n=1 Tax=Candidatus Poriferisocius sp. TaxID=3101276 RepID=UPI003B01C8F5